MPTPESILFGHLYKTAPDNPFFDVLCTKTDTFVYAEQTPVAEFKPLGETGHHCLVTESRMPASFWSVLVTSPEQVVREFSTGSGYEMGRLMRRLCEAFQKGEASLDYAFDSSGETPHFAQPGEEDGRPCEVTTVEDGWEEIMVDEAYGLHGKKQGFCFYVHDKPLALDLAKNFANGMLDMERPVVKAPMARVS